MTEERGKSYEVTVTDVAARPTAVVAAATTWQEFPSLWGKLLDEVWACLRAGGITGGAATSCCTGTTCRMSRSASN